MIYDDNYRYIIIDKRQHIFCIYSDLYLYDIVKIFFLR